MNLIDQIAGEQSRPRTLNEIHAFIDNLLQQECSKTSAGYVHRRCGGMVRKGFVNLFYCNKDGSLDPGADGFGIGPYPIPYCENCNPPDGFNHTFAKRIPVSRDENV